MMHVESSFDHIIGSRSLGRLGEYCFVLFSDHNPASSADSIEVVLGSSGSIVKYIHTFTAPYKFFKEFTIQ
jgi:hypothetical protein